MIDQPPDRPTTETGAWAGFPQYEHNQYTIEGEIERLQAFGQAGSSARGWRRTVAIIVALSLCIAALVPLISLAVWAATR